MSMLFERIITAANAVSANLVKESGTKRLIFFVSYVMSWYQHIEKKTKLNKYWGPVIHLYLFGTRFRRFSSITFDFQSLNSYWSKMIQRLSMSITRCQYNMLILIGSLRLPKVFLRANRKVMFLASWVTSQSLFPIVYLNSCHWEDSWICSIGRIYLCVFGHHD